MQAAITKNCAAAVAHARSRKAYKAAVIIEPTAASYQQTQAGTDTAQAHLSQETAKQAVHLQAQSPGVIQPSKQDLFDKSAKRSGQQESRGSRKKRKSR